MTDTTTINNNLTLSTGKVFNIDGYSNVKTTLDNYNTSINTINTTLTDISFLTDTTTINNNLTLSTGKILSIPSYSDVKTTLDNYNTSINTINTSLSGISYLNSSGQDLTTIDNNLTVSKILSIPSYSDVKTTLDNYNTSINTINTSLSGISYLNSSGQDLTIIDNNLTVSKLFNIDGYSNVKSHLDYIYWNIEHIVNETTYTAIYNDFTVENGYKLKVSDTFTDVATTLQTLTTSTNTSTDNLTGITYLTTSDTTNISNNVTISTGKILSIPNYPNVESTLTSLTASINYLNIMTFEDDFIDGFSSNPMTWASTGTGFSAQISDEQYYMGIVRISAGNDRILYPSNTNNSYFWNSFVRMDFCFRTIVGNANVNFVIGLSENSAYSGNSISWFYTGTQWELRVDNVAVQTAPTLTLTSNDWWFGSIIKLSGTKMLRFYLKNLTTGTVRDWSSVSSLTNISTTASYRPFFRVTDTAFSSPYLIENFLDIDYVKIQYNTGRPYTV